MHFVLLSKTTEKTTSKYQKLWARILHVMYVSVFGMAKYSEDVARRSSQGAGPPVPGCCVLPEQEIARAR
jgi:hypothetical protein